MSNTRKISISLDDSIYGPLAAKLLDEIDRTGRKMSFTELISRMLARSLGVDISHVKFRSPRSNTVNKGGGRPSAESKLTNLENELLGYWPHREMIPLDSYLPSDPFRKRMEVAIELAKQGLIAKPEGME